jgi:hypothetical protein
MVVDELPELVPGHLVSVPMLADDAGGHGLGFSNVWPGGFAQRMILSVDSALKVPNGGRFARS